MALDILLDKIRITYFVYIKVMSPFSYAFKVRLRIEHPTLDPDVITETLSIEPIHYWKVGSKKKIYNQTQSNEKNEFSYWVAPLDEKERTSSNEITLDNYLLTFTDSLKNHSSFFHKINEAGGKVEYFIGLFGGENVVFIFNYKMLNFLNELGIGLIFDIYPNNE